MPRKRYTDEQILSILNELRAGATAAELSRKHGVHPNTLSGWKTRYENMGLSEIKRLRLLEMENQKLKNMVAEQALDIRSLKELLSKNF